MEGERKKALARQQQLGSTQQSWPAMLHLLRRGWLRAAWAVADHTRNALILSVFGFKVGSPAAITCRTFQRPGKLLVPALEPCVASQLQGLGAQPGLHQMVLPSVAAHCSANPFPTVRMQPQQAGKPHASFHGCRGQLYLL